MNHFHIQSDICSNYILPQASSESYYIPVEEEQKQNYLEMTPPMTMGSNKILRIQIRLVLSKIRVHAWLQRGSIFIL